MQNTDNIVTISGRLTRNAETIMDGKQLKFSIAVDNSGYERDNPDNRTGFFDCYVWMTESQFSPAAFTSDLQDLVKQGRLNQGAPVSIVGSLNHQRFVDKDGNKRSAVAIEVSALTSYAKAANNDNQENPQVIAQGNTANAVSDEEPF